VIEERGNIFSEHKLRAVDNVASYSVRVGPHARPLAAEEMSMLKSQSPAGENEDQSSVSSNQNMLEVWGQGTIV
jgi:hypothetical protein